MSEPTTIASLLAKTKTFLAGRQIASAQLDAQVLLAHVLGVDRMSRFMQSDRPLSETEIAQYRDLVVRRGKGEPVAYLVGSRGFWTLDLKVDSRVLIPRPETERIVEAVLEFVGNAAEEREWKVVDVGTGSGALAVALASELDAATVVALDISQDALDLATENAVAAGVKSRFHAIRGNLLEPLVRKGSKADVIVSNPPYIPESDRDSLMRDVRDFEPALALFSGGDGLDLIRTLIPQAAQTLQPEGLFAMEFGMGQHDTILQLAQKHFAKAAILRDLSRVPRVLLASHEFDVTLIVQSLEANLGPGTRTDPDETPLRFDTGAGKPAIAMPAAVLPEGATFAEQQRAAAWQQVQEEQLPVIDLDDL